MGRPCDVGALARHGLEASFQTDLTLWHGTFDVQLGVCFLDVGDNIGCLFSKFLLLCFLKFLIRCVRNRINCT